MKSVCFTGHRNIKETAELKKALIKQLVKLIDEGATDFYAGGAVGWDMLCESAIIELRERFPHIQLHLILPCPVEEQTEKWCENDKSEFRRLLLAADTVEICSKNYFDGCMKLRNQRLVNLADLCVCYYSGKQRSGTGQTVQMAKRQGKEIINFVNA